MCIRDRKKAGYSVVVDEKAIVVHHDDSAFRAISAPTFAQKLRKLTAVSYTHLRAHETVLDLVCRLLLEQKKQQNKKKKKAQKKKKHHNVKQQQQQIWYDN